MKIEVKLQKAYTPREWLTQRYKVIVKSRGGAMLVDTGLLKPEAEVLIKQWKEVLGIKS